MRWQIAERGESPTFQAQAEESSHDRATRAVSGAPSAATRARSGPQSLAAASSDGCSADGVMATRSRAGSQARLVRLATSAAGANESGWRGVRGILVGVASAGHFSTVRARDLDKRTGNGSPSTSRGWLT